MGRSSRNDQNDLKSFNDLFSNEKNQPNKPNVLNPQKMRIQAETQIVFKPQKQTQEKPNECFSSQLFENFSNEVKKGEEKMEQKKIPINFSSKCLNLINEIDKQEENRQCEKHNTQNEECLIRSLKESDKVLKSNTMTKAENSTSIQMFSNQLIGKNNDFQNINDDLEQTQNKKKSDHFRLENNGFFDNICLNNNSSEHLDNKNEKTVYYQRPIPSQNPLLFENDKKLNIDKDHYSNISFEKDQKPD